MKTGTPDHPKTKALARMLKAPRCVAIGVLEALWHATAKFAPRGDIGRFSDEEIADLCFWEDGAPLLISALVGSGWLDARAKGRLVVHDWHEHAEDAVHMRLARASDRFFNGSIPRLSRLPPEEKAIARAKYDAKPCPRRAHGKRTTSTPPSPPNPSPPLPSPPTPSVATEPDLAAPGLGSGGSGEPVADALARIGVNAASIAIIAACPGIGIAEVRREWASVVRANGTVRNRPGLLVDRLCKAHGIQRAPPKSSGSVGDQLANERLRQIRRQRGIGTG